MLITGDKRDRRAYIPMTYASALVLMITPVAPMVTSADANALLPGPALCIEVDPAPGPGFLCPPLIHSKHVNTQVCICIAP